MTLKSFGRLALATLCLAGPAGMIPALASPLPTAAVATADDEKSESESGQDSKSESKTEKKVEVRTMVTGQRVTIGPDGEVKIEKIGDLDDGLPSDVQKRIKEVMKEARINMNQVKGLGDKFEFRFDIDEESSSADSDSPGQNKTSQFAKGSVTIIGPDGKKKSFDFGGEGVDTEKINREVEAMLEKNEDISEDIRKRVREAMKKVPGQMGRIQFPAGPARLAILRDDNKQLDELTKKLDTILERLDRLEADVKKLRDR